MRLESAVCGWLRYRVKQAGWEERIEMDENKLLAAERRSLAMWIWKQKFRHSDRVQEVGLSRMYLM